MYASDRKQGGAGEFPYPAFLRVLLNCGVTVYCYDVNPEPDKRRPELGSATNMKFRNEAMASTVLHENCIRRPGVVLLNGAKHFKRISDSKADCTGLHTLCDIPDRAVFKLADLG